MQDDLSSDVSSRVFTPTSSSPSYDTSHPAPYGNTAGSSSLGTNRTGGGGGGSSSSRNGQASSRSGQQNDGWTNGQLVDPGRFEQEEEDDDDGFDAWDEDVGNTDGARMDQAGLMEVGGNKNSTQPLLGKEERGRPSYESPAGSSRPPFHSRRSTFRSRSPDYQAAVGTRRKYTYAAFFLGLSLVSFVIQTETASYITKELDWKKPYCMLWLTHGSWSLLWPITFLLIRLQKRNVPFDTVWRRHKQLLRTTAQMVQHQQLHLGPKNAQTSPIPYMLRTTALITTALTIAGSSWYVALDLTTASDLTAIYNCSAFFAYAFSIPLLGDKLRWTKIVSVAIAIVGVLVVAYGDTSSPEGGESDAEKDEAKNQLLGNIIIGVGSVLYGLYEVLYKKLACPPEGTSPGRGMVFSMTVGSLIGSFTLFVLWIPLPFLHVTGIETFVIPTGETAWILFVSVLMNATFSGSFLTLISLTSPVLSSVAALLTIFLVAITDWLLFRKPIHAAAVVGGLLIIGAFLMLTWDTYQETVEERRRKEQEDPVSTDDDE